MPWLALRGAVVMGFVAIALQGGPSAWIGLVGGTAALLPLAGWRPLQHSMVWGWFTALVLGGLGIAGGLGIGASVGLGILLSYLQVHRRITGHGRVDDRISLLLSALMLVSSAGAGAGPAFLVVATVWAACVPVALMPSATRPVAALVHAAVALVVASAVFVIAPRPPHTDVGGERIELTGYADQVELGALDELLQDPGVVFRAKLPVAVSDAGRRIYWRGVALDSFDGTRWTATLPPAAVTQAQDRPVGAISIEVVREPSIDGTLFVPGRVLHVDADEVPLARDPHGAWFARESGARLRYRAAVAGPLDGSEALFAEERSGDPVLMRARQLPGPLRSEVEAMARRVAGEGPPLEQAERIARHLRDRYTYTRAPDTAGTDAPLQRFLFDHRAGHCEYFASGLAVLARARGIPARVVNGFVTEDAAPDGWLTVRKHHAHSWVEVHVPGDGWRLLDATPGPGAPPLVGGFAQEWERVQRWWLAGFLAYDGERQLQAVAGAQLGRPGAWRGWLGGALTGLGGGLAGWWLVDRLSRRRRGTGPRQRSPGPVARQHRIARRRLERSGIAFPPALPPVAAAQWYAADQPGPVADALQRLAWLTYETELGGRDSSTAMPEARSLVREVTRAVRAQGR